MTEANWYPDPIDPTLLRYHDGQAWTEHTAPAAPAAPAQGTGVISPGLAASSLFSTENREQDTTGRMTRQNPAVVKVTLGESLMVNRGAMIAYQGTVTFAYQGSGASRFFKGAVGGEGVKLMRCEGAGEVFVSHQNKKLHLLELGTGEAISASSRSLLGFDSSVSWDIEMIKGGIGALAAGGLFNVTLTGPGTVIIASDWPVVLDTSQATTCVDPNAIVAWAAGLTITTKSSMSAGALIGRGSGEAMQLQFAPGGWVIVEPEGFQVVA